MASLAELAAQDPYQWYQTEGGSQAFGIPGQQPIAEFLPSTNEVYWYRGGQVPQEILARFPGARVRDVTTDPAFEYGRTDDFAGNLGDYMPQIVATLVSQGMISPWLAAGNGLNASSLAELASQYPEAQGLYDGIGQAEQGLQNAQSGNVQVASLGGITDSPVYELMPGEPGYVGPSAGPTLTPDYRALNESIFKSPSLGSGITPGARGITGLTSGAAGVTGITPPVGGIGDWWANIPPWAGPALTGAGVLSSLLKEGGSVDPGSFKNPDGTYGSTAANSGVGGSGAAPVQGAATGSTPWMTGESIYGKYGDKLTSIQALKNILANGGTVDDWLKTAGAVGPALLGAYASNQQSNSLADLASKYEGYGAPSRGRYEGSFAPGFTMAQDPGYQDALDQAAKATLHGMSAKFGNPAGSPNAWAATLQDLYKGTAYPALQSYRNQNSATSGIGAFNAAAPQAQTGQLQAQGNIYNAIGSGIGNVFSPAPTLADIVRQFQTLKG